MSEMLGMEKLEKELGKIIPGILRAYCRIPSFTSTPGETLVDDFFREQLVPLPYFRNHPGQMGSWVIENDPLNRRVNWAMIRGGSGRTVVLMHHSDVVVTDNYGPFQDLALDPDALETAFRDDPALLDEDARQDLASGEWMFGRGTADMKGGGAIHLALLSIYARWPEEKRNDLPTLVFLALPDEENLSAGMRSALGLLARLKAEHGLDYALMINSEPHQRLIPERGVICQGSIAKLNLFVYVRGVMAHAGKVLEGMNPTAVMANIVAQTDLSDAFVDRAGREMSIPPTWVYLRDLKQQYDISFPEACYGMFNVLNFHTSPGDVMEKMVRICRQALSDHIGRVNTKRRAFSRETGRNWPDVTWQPRVLTYGELKAMTPDPPAETTVPPAGPRLEALLEQRLSGLLPGEPVIVVGLCPPFYPGVANPDQERLHTMVRNFTQKRFGQDYDNQAYFTGISDLSYAMSAGRDRSPEQTMGDTMAHMAGWGETYDIPFDHIQTISMDCINIGPWGKDFHKASERVLKEDLFRRTPLLIHHIICRHKGEKDV